MPVGRSGSRLSFELRAPIEVRLLVEVRTNDHAGRGVHLAVPVAHGARLGHRLWRAADEVLRLARLDPKMRRKVRKVGDDGHVGRLRACGGERFVHGPIEVRNDRYHHVRSGLAPVPPQAAGHRAVAQANESLQQLEFLREPDAPAALQARVVEVFPVHARGLQKHIFGIENFYQIDEPNLPRPALRADDGLERRSSGTMSASRVEVNQVDAFVGGRVVHFRMSSGYGTAVVYANRAGKGAARRLPDSLTLVGNATFQFIEMM